LLPLPSKLENLEKNKITVKEGAENKAKALPQENAPSLLNENLNFIDDLKIKESKHAKIIPQ